MQVTVTGKHIEITEPIKQYAIEKASKLPRFFDRVLSIEVVADKGENHSFDVEMIAHVEHHDAFVARARSEDLYACIDESSDKMERQLTDHKEKLRNHKHSASH